LTSYQSCNSYGPTTDVSKALILYQLTSFQISSLYGNSESSVLGSPPTSCNALKAVASGIVPAPKSLHRLVRSVLTSPIQISFRPLGKIAALRSNAAPPSNGSPTVQVLNSPLIAPTKPPSPSAISLPSTCFPLAFTLLAGSLKVSSLIAAKSQYELFTSGTTK
jgi:hypothetical protein